MPAALPRWVRLGASAPLARLVVLVLAAVGHVLFLASISGGSLPLKLTFVLASANLAALALAAFRPKPRPLSVARLFLLVVALNAALGLAGFLCGALGSAFASGRVGVLSGLLVAIVFSVVGGSFGSIAVVPLGLALDRWRRDPTPRTVLDAGATLACLAAIFALVRPVGLAERICACALNPQSVRCDEIARGKVLAGADVAMACFAVALAVALWWTERRARRWLAAARAGTLPGYRLVALADADAATAPGWGLTRAPAQYALLGEPAVNGYRERPTAVVLALIPQAEDASWREGAMFVVLALSAMVCALRYLL